MLYIKKKKNEWIYGTWSKIIKSRSPFFWSNLLGLDDDGLISSSAWFIFGELSQCSLEEETNYDKKGGALSIIRPIENNI